MMTEIKNAIPYTGVVELKIQLKNGEEIVVETHNSAYPFLSAFFARAMAGYNTQSIAPTQCVLEQDGVVITPIPIAITGKNSNTTVTINDVGTYTAFSFNVLITSKYLSAATKFQEKDTYLILQNGEGDRFASVHLTKTLSNYVDESKNLIVNWKMILWDSTVEGEEE